MLAALLSVLPSLSDLAGSPSDKPVFSPLSPVWLSKDTLVDFLAGQPVSLRILRASWAYGCRSADVYSDGDRGRGRVCAGRVTLPRDSLVGAEDVKQLRCRVCRPGGGSPGLTVEAARRDLARDPGMGNRDGLSYR